MKLKTYQEKAIDKLISRTRELLSDDIKNKTIVFQSPTGSGKTLMMAEYIANILDELDDVDLCFLWVCIGKGDLHQQSYNSLNHYFAGYPDVSLLDESYFSSRQSIGENEVVVVNWEKLRSKDKKTGEWKNNLMKDRETINFREIIKNTQEDGRNIVMIIDESHSNSTSDRALELRDEVIQPSLTIEMSATPALTGNQYNEKVKVQPSDVIDEGMIKKEIVINEKDKDQLEKVLFSGVKDELKNSISIRVTSDISNGFRVGLKDEEVYYDFSDESIAEVLKSLINPKLKEILDK